MTEHDIKQDSRDAFAAFNATALHLMTAGVTPPVLVSAMAHLIGSFIAALPSNKVDAVKDMVTLAIDMQERIARIKCGDRIP